MMVKQCRRRDPHQIKELDAQETLALATSNQQYIAGPATAEAQGLLKGALPDLPRTLFPITIIATNASYLSEKLVIACPSRDEREEWFVALTAGDANAGGVVHHSSGMTVQFAPPP